MKNIFTFLSACFIIKCALSQSYTTNGPYILKDCVPWEGRGTDKMSVFGGNPGDTKSWGMDIVRECIDMKMTSLTKLRQMADNAKTNGQVVIFAAFWFDHTDFGGSTPYPNCQLLGNNPRQDNRWNAVSQRWKDIANEFKNDSHVWFGWWNEPYMWDGTNGYTDALWRDDAIAMINVIRSTGAQNIIVLAGSHMGQGHDVLLAEGQTVLQGQSNVVFDLHCYDHKWNISQAQVEARFKAIFDAGLPLIVGEFGNNGNEVYTNIIGACINRRVSGLAWLWGQYNANFTTAVQQYAGGTRLTPFGNPGCTTTTCTPPTVTAYTNVNNTGWVQKDSAVLCQGGSLSFGPQPVTSSGWSWTGPNSFTSSQREISFNNAQTNLSGVYTATYNDGGGCSASKKYYLTVNVLPTVTSMANVNNNGWVQTNSITMCEGGTVAFGPWPWQDPNGWSWTGPNSFTASVREISFNNAQTGLSGVYTASYTDANGCTGTKNFNLTVDVCTGINALNENKTISIYPNPVSTKFTISVSPEQDFRNTVLKIYDVLGKEVKNISIHNHETIVERAELQSGIYFYNIINNNAKIGNGKLVVQ